MKRYFILSTIFFFALSLFAKSVTPAASLPAYYKDINGKSGKSLFDAVQMVTKLGYSSLGYDGLWGAYKKTDIRDNGKIWDMYSDCSWTVGSDQCGSYNNECDCYNREHSIPKSWFGGSKSGPGCDIFQVVPTDGYVNNRRSNYAFGEVSSASYTYDGAKLGSAKSITITGGNTIAGNTGASVSYSGTVFEPRDEYKGDFARGYFGTMIKWANGDYSAFTTGDGGKIFSSNYSTGAFGLTQYGVALLMKWHRQDPVSKKEVDRNNGIQQTQGNRNPFIDYPYLAEFIWGEMSGQVLDFDQLLCSADELFQLGVSNGYLGEVQDMQLDTILWMVGDTQYDCTYHLHGSKVKNLPDAPTSCSATSTTFMGWTNTPMKDVAADAPTILYTKVSDFPAINTNTKYYAVFAQELTSEIQEEIIQLNVDQSNPDWTLNNVTTSSTAAVGNFWILCKDAAITSPAIDLQTLSSITMTLRSYYNHNTVVIAIDGNTIGELVATSTDMANYTWNVTEPLSGTKSLQFTSKTNTTTRGVNVKDISIRLGGTQATYTNYLTHCASGPATVLTTTTNANHAVRKIIRNGQLLIIHNGQIYNTLGNNIELR